LLLRLILFLVAVRQEAETVMHFWSKTFFLPILVQEWLPALVFQPGCLSITQLTDAHEAEMVLKA